MVPPTFSPQLGPGLALHFLPTPRTVAMCCISAKRLRGAGSRCFHPESDHSEHSNVFRRVDLGGGGTWEGWPPPHASGLLALQTTWCNLLERCTCCQGPPHTMQPSAHHQPPHPAPSQLSCQHGQGLAPHQQFLGCQASWWGQTLTFWALGLSTPQINFTHQPMCASPPSQGQIQPNLDQESCFQESVPLKLSCA